jgi:PQQ-dependent catabolism-associated CXXCW motif protein
MVGIRTAAIIMLAASTLASGTAPGENLAIDEPESYRSDNYRSPTPAALRGARVVSTAEAQAIWRKGSAAFVDVLPYAPRPPDLPAGTLWREQRRLNIPGSTWLPDTGYAELSASAEEYLRSGLERATGGNRAIPVLIYCLRDCWMSWNAAKRAVSWGYTGVIWYPDGTDGWQDAGLPLAESSPASRPAE